MKLSEFSEVINSFDFDGELEEVRKFGSGHINETYCTVFTTKNRTKALYSPENEQAYFSGSCWAYGKHQWCYFLVKEKKSGKWRGHRARNFEYCE